MGIRLLPRADAGRAVAGSKVTRLNLCQSDLFFVYAAHFDIHVACFIYPFVAKLLAGRVAVEKKKNIHLFLGRFILLLSVHDLFSKARQLQCTGSTM